MKVYLTRHAMAGSHAVDKERSLTAEGIKQAEKLGLMAKEKLVTIQTAYHSGYLRADQTCSLILKALGLEITPEISEHLRPLSNPSIWANQLLELKEDLLIVTHLPFIEKLAHYLAGPEFEVEFHTATMVCLERNDQSNLFNMIWSITST